ncbi:MAG: hypothetical protein R2758_07525 [Bacteroidales bacterium]
MKRISTAFESQTILVSGILVTYADKVSLANVIAFESAGGLRKYVDRIRQA